MQLLILIKEEYINEIRKRMELFPSEEKGFSYLMLFDDYNKVDLTRSSEPGSTA